MVVVLSCRRLKIWLDMAWLWRLNTAIGINPKQALESPFHLDRRFLDYRLNMSIEGEGAPRLLGSWVARSS